MNLGAGDVAPLVKFLLLVYEAWAASPEVSRLGLVMQICDPNFGEVGRWSWPFTVLYISSEEQGPLSLPLQVLQF